MKRAILLSVALLTAGVAQAEDESVELCVGIHSLAQSVMAAYQGGVPITELLDMAEDDKLLRGMVLEAYDGVRFSSQRNQQEAIERFANGWGMACYIHLKSAK